MIKIDITPIHRNSDAITKRTYGIGTSSGLVGLRLLAADTGSDIFHNILFFQTYDFLFTVSKKRMRKQKY